VVLVAWMGGEGSGVRSPLGVDGLVVKRDGWICAQQECEEERDYKTRCGY
jgi:hypothetical protein